MHDVLCIILQTDQPAHIDVTPTVDTYPLTMDSSTNIPQATSTCLEQLNDFIIPGKQVRLLETLGQGNVDKVNVSIIIQMIQFVYTQTS